MPHTTFQLGVPELTSCQRPCVYAGQTAASCVGRAASCVGKRSGCAGEVQWRRSSIGGGLWSSPVLAPLVGQRGRASMCRAGPVRTVAIFGSVAMPDFLFRSIGGGWWYSQSPPTQRLARSPRLAEIRRVLKQAALAWRPALIASRPSTMPRPSVVCSWCHRVSCCPGG